MMTLPQTSVVVGGNVLISAHQAARILGVRPFAIQNAIAVGNLPAQRLGRIWVLTLTDVEEYARNRRAPNGQAKRRPISTDKGYTGYRWPKLKLAPTANPTPCTIPQSITPPDLDASDYEDSID